MDNVLVMTGIGFLSIIVVLLISYLVWSIKHPYPSNWIETGGSIDRKSWTIHVAECGLIYPAIFVYVWVGLNCLRTACVIQ